MEKLPPGLKGISRPRPIRAKALHGPDGKLAGVGDGHGYAPHGVIDHRGQPVAVALYPAGADRGAAEPQRRQRQAAIAAPRLVAPVPQLKAVARTLDSQFQFHIHLRPEDQERIVDGLYRRHREMLAAGGAQIMAAVKITFQIDHQFAHQMTALGGPDHPADALAEVARRRQFDHVADFPVVDAPRRHHRHAFGQILVIGVGNPVENLPRKGQRRGGAGIGLAVGGGHAAGQNQSQPCHNGDFFESVCDHTEHLRVMGLRIISPGMGLPSAVIWPTLTPDPVIR